MKEEGIQTPKKLAQSQNQSATEFNISYPIKPDQKESIMAKTKSELLSRRSKKPLTSID